MTVGGSKNFNFYDNFQIDNDPSGSMNSLMRIMGKEDTIIVSGNLKCCKLFFSCLENLENKNAMGEKS